MHPHRIMKIFFTFAIVFLLTSCSVAPSKPDVLSGKIWQFVVSGDSRNCGDVVMPIIAKRATADQAQFYWHLGDFRALYKMDEDMAKDPKYKSFKTLTPPEALSAYQAVAWDDFIEHELKPFGKIPVYLGTGNHEFIQKTREDFIAKFSPWLELPLLQQARDRDGLMSKKTYFHWVQSGVDFISLDNSTDDEFDSAQMSWFNRVLNRDLTDPSIRTLVVGMHKALPDSISFGHSMSESKNQVSVASGRDVYRALLKARNNYRKNVYVLASHSHFFMDGTFNTDYWENNGGVLPGWIIGTAGAIRYPLPKDSKRANSSNENKYGYLLATVNSNQDRMIRFDFQEVNRSEVLPETLALYGKALVDFCFDQNRSEQKHE
jgi:hypothetical protein